MRLRYCTVEANYWQAWRIARLLCDSRATSLDIALQIIIFSTKKWQLITPSVFKPCWQNFAQLLTTVCAVVAKLFCIISCNFFFLNRLRFSYFIIKRVVLQFFSDTRGRWRCSYYNLPFVRIMFTVHVFQAITAEPITAEFHMYTFLTTRTADWSFILRRCEQWLIQNADNATVMCEVQLRRCEACDGGGLWPGRRTRTLLSAAAAENSTVAICRSQGTGTTGRGHTDRPQTARCTLTATRLCHLNYWGVVVVQCD